MTVPKAAIELRTCRKVNGGKAAVDGLTLNVPQGCFFGFLGPNGAGKTTTIKMLMGLARPSSGHIRLLGHDMPGAALEIKEQIGLVPDESLLFRSPDGRRRIPGIHRPHLWIGSADRADARDRTAGSVRVERCAAQADRGIFEGHAQARGHGCGADPSAEAVPARRAVTEGVRCSGHPRLMKDILLEQVHRERHDFPDVARAGGCGAPVRPRRHHPRGAISDRKQHAGAARRRRIAGGRVRARRGRGARRIARVAVAQR